MSGSVSQYPSVAAPSANHLTAGPSVAQTASVAK